MRKKELIKFRSTSLEKAIIQKKAKNTGLSLSAFCRAAALDQKIGYKLTDEELEAYKNLTKFHNNFINISNLLQKKDPALSKLVTDTALDIKNHLKKFQ